MKNFFLGIWRSVPGKVRPWLLSLLCGSTLLLFWAYLDQAAKLRFAAPTPVDPISDGQPAARPAVPAGYFDDDEVGEEEWDDDESERSNVRPVQPPPVVQVPAPPPAAGNYRDGTYSAASDSAWGKMEIEVTVDGGRWSGIKAVTIPDSPPSYYAVTELIEQALAAQNDRIDGVSGATNTSDAFRADLTQIVALSKK